MDLNERILLRSRERRSTGRLRRGGNDAALKPYRPYYDDVGFRMDPQSHVEYVKTVEKLEKDYNKKVNEINKSRSSAEAAYNDALKKLKGTIVDPNKAWKEAKRDFLPVRVYTGNRLEGVYYLPRDVIEGLNTQVFNQGDGSYVGNWKEKGKAYNVDTVPRGTSSGYGKELHQLLKDTEDQLYSQFMAEAKRAQKESRRAYDKQKAALDTELAGTLKTLDASRSALDTQRDQFYQPIRDAKSDYERRLKNRRRLFK